MHKIIIVATVALLFAAAIPPTLAETKTAGYDVPSGASGNTRGGVSTRLCATEWDNWDEGAVGDSTDQTLFGPAGFTADDNPDDTIGKTVVTPAATAACSTTRSAWAEDGIKVGIYSDGIQAESDIYFDFQVSVTDALPALPFFSFCIITAHEDGSRDTSCGDTKDDPRPDFRVATCGQGSLTTDVGSGGPLNRPTAFVYATFVDETTGNLCLASQGTLTVSMS